MTRTQDNGQPTLSSFIGDAALIIAIRTGNNERVLQMLGTGPQSDLGINAIQPIIEAISSPNNVPVLTQMRNSGWVIPANRREFILSELLSYPNPEVLALFLGTPELAGIHTEQTMNRAWLPPTQEFVQNLAQYQLTYPEMAEYQEMSRMIANLS